MRIYFSRLNNRFLLFDCFSVNAYLLSNESLEELNEFFWDFRPVIFRMRAVFYFCSVF